MHLIKNKNLIQKSSYVNGEWLDSGSTFEVFNPATGKAFAQISEVSSLEVENAINSAAKAFEKWKLTSYEQRCNILLEWQKRLRENSQDLARILTSEQGKPLSEAVGEILHSADYIKIYAEQLHLFTGPNLQQAPQKHYLLCTFLQICQLSLHQMIFKLMHRTFSKHYLSS